MPLDPIKVFISYSQVDEAWKTKLVKHLGQSRREKLIDLWHDGMINAGTEWSETIESKLNAADIVLLLLSADFLDSDYCNEHEIPAAMSRHHSGSAKVIPVVLRHCAWKETPMGIDSLQVYPKGGVPVQTWASSDEPLLDVASRVAQLAREIRDERQRARIELEKARHQYRQKVDETLSDRQISIGERDTLDELRRRLGLSQEDADEIEVEAHKPITAYAETIEEYKKTLRKHIAQRYPLRDDQRKDLGLRKRDLGLKDEDAAATEALVLAEAENDHKAQLAAMAAEAEAQEIDRRNKARQRAADALLSATAAVEKKQFAIARKHVAAARAADPEHPDVTGWDAKISDAAAGARREAESELNSAKDALGQKQFAIARKHVAAARAADPEHPDVAGWAKEPVRTALMAFKGLDRFFLAPEIPAEKSQNARSRCQIPPGEELLAIIDLTMFGSAKECWAFTDVALHYHLIWRDRAMLKYEDFPQRIFQPHFWSNESGGQGSGRKLYSLFTLAAVSARSRASRFSTRLKRPLAAERIGWNTSLFGAVPEYGRQRAVLSAPGRMGRSAAPDRSRRVTHFPEERFRAAVFSKPDQRCRKQSSAHGLLRKVAMRSLGGGDRLGDSSQGQIGLSEARMRHLPHIHSDHRRVIRFAAVVEIWFIDPGHSLHVCRHRRVARQREGAGPLLCRRRSNTRRTRSRRDRWSRIPLRKEISSSSLRASDDAHSGSCQSDADAHIGVPPVGWTNRHRAVRAPAVDAW